jgi:hypothetical protein
MQAAVAMTRLASGCLMNTNDGRREQRHQHHQDGEVRHHGAVRSASGATAVSRVCASSTSRRSSSATTSSSVEP